MDTSAEQHIFDENYERTLRHLQDDSQRPDFSLARVEGELDALYIYEGQDWGGRGEPKHAEIAGNILAYQVFLRRWREEHPPASGTEA